MVRIGRFEVNVLTCTEQANSNQDWRPTKEYEPPNCEAHRIGRCASKYIIAPPATDSEGSTVPTAFAIHFKVHGPLSEQFMDGAELIVFRVFHDDKRIGSGHVKRKDWERSLTYTVRKSSRRFWLQDQNGWIKLNWHLDEGLHGQLRVEVWRQVESRSYSGSWDTGLDIPFISHEGNEYVDYFDPVVGVTSKEPRVRFTKPMNSDPGAQPDVKFVFEYRPEETMRTIGVMKAPASSRPKLPTVPVAPIYDLTGDDESWPAIPSSQQIYDISDCSVASPTKTVSSNYTSDGIWSNTSMPNNELYNSFESIQYTAENAITVPPLQSNDLYMQNAMDYTLPHMYQQQNFLPAFETTKTFQAQTEYIDLTMEE